MILNMISFACPAILASFGALFSEYAGCLALFLDGLINLSAYLTFAFTTLTGSTIIGILLSASSSLLIVFCFSILIERFKANKFIAGIALNLLFSALPTFFSSVTFKTRGVLTSSFFSYNVQTIKIFAIIITMLLCIAGIIFLIKHPYGLYLRITGTDSEVLMAKGINPSITRVLGWSLTGLYGSVAGTILVLRLSSFVPNISSGRGWMALAAVFLGKKKPIRIIICVLIFCCADFFSASIQNLIPAVPTSVLLSFPYLIALSLVFFNII